MGALQVSACARAQRLVGTPRAAEPTPSLRRMRTPPSNRTAPRAPPHLEAAHGEEQVGVVARVDRHEAVVPLQRGDRARQAVAHVPEHGAAEVDVVLHQPHARVARPALGGVMGGWRAGVRGCRGGAQTTVLQSLIKSVAHAHSPRTSTTTQTHTAETNLQRKHNHIHNAQKHNQTNTHQ